MFLLSALCCMNYCICNNEVSYNDFSNLIVLAVGLNIVYIVSNFRKEPGEDSFFIFLKGITDSTRKKRVNLQAKALKEEEKMKAKLEYALSFKDDLSTDASGAFKSIINYLNKREWDIRNLTDEYDERIKKLGVAYNLPVIALMSFLYGLFILVLSPFHKNNLNTSLVFSNILITIFVIVCITKGLLKKESDKKSPFQLYPLMFLFIIISLFTNILILKCSTIENILGICKYNYFYTLFVCFIGFISCLLITFIGSSWLLHKCKREINKLKISASLSTLKEQIDMYKDELRRIEEMTTTVVLEEVKEEKTEEKKRDMA